MNYSLCIEHRCMYLGSVLHARDVIQGNEATVLVSAYSRVLCLTQEASADNNLSIIPQNCTTVVTVCAGSFLSACEEHGATWRGDRPPTWCRWQWTRSPRRRGTRCCQPPRRRRASSLARLPSASARSSGRRRRLPPPLFTSSSSSGAPP